MTAALDGFLPEAMRTRLAHDGTPRAERIGVAMLFIDVSGFTRLTETLAAQGPEGIETLTRALNEGFGRLIDRVHQHGGDVVSFAGDALSAVWNTFDDESATDALARCARCSLLLQEESRSWELSGGVRLSLRIAAAFAPVHLVSLGRAGTRRLFFPTGPALAQIAVALPAADPGDVVVSAEAATALGSVARTQPKGAARRLESVTPAGPPRPLTITQVDAAHLPDVLTLVPRAIRSVHVAGPVEWMAELRRVTTAFVALPQYDLTQPWGVEAMDAVVRTVQGFVDRLDGDIDKIVADEKGTTLIAAWGLPKSTHEDDPSRALRACRLIQRELARFPGGGSVGMSTGDVYCGAIGGARREYTMMGTTINRAARLLQQSGSRLLCDVNTQQAAHTDAGFVEIERLTAKGFAEPIRAFVPSGDRSNAPARKTDKLVGREAELARLCGIVDEYRATSRGQAVLIEGEGGIGKSRLVLELRKHCEYSGAEVLQTSADRIESTTPYQAIGPAIAQLCRLPMDTDLARTALMERLGTDPVRRDRAPLLNDVLRLGMPENPFTMGLNDQARSDNLVALVVDLLGESAAARPVVMVLEDLHWFDAASMSMLQALIRNVENVVFAMSTRPRHDADADAWSTLRNSAETVRIELGPIPATSTAEVLRNALDATSIPRAIIDIANQRAGGNPFYIGELVLALRETGLIRVEGGVCSVGTADGRIDWVALPTTLQRVVHSRIDRLSAEQQVFLKIACVIGRTFDLSTLDAVWPIARHDRSCRVIAEEVEATRIIERTASDPDVMEFKHAIVSDALYDALLFAHRREIHGAAGAALEVRYHDDIAAHAAVLAWHFEHAEAWNLAIRYLAIGGEHALERNANADCLRLYTRALEIVAEHKTPIGADEVAAWRGRMTEAAFRTGDMEAASVHGRAAVQLLGSPLPTSGIGTAWQLTRAIVERNFPKLVRLFTPPQSEQERKQLSVVHDAYQRLTDALAFRVEIGAALLSACRARAAAIALGDAASSEIPNLMLYFVLAATPMAKWVSTWPGRALESAATSLDPAVANRVIGRVGVAWMQRSDFARADEAFHRSLAAAHRLGDVRLIVETEFAAGFSSLMQGYLARAERHFITTSEAARVAGDDQFQAWSAIGRATVAAQCGDAVHAEDLIRTAHVWLAARNEPAAYLWGQGVRAHTALALGRTADARDVVEAAIVRAEGEPILAAYWLLFGLEGLTQTAIDLAEQNPAERDLARRAVKQYGRLAQAVPAAIPRHLLHASRLDRLNGRDKQARATLEKVLAAIDPRAVPELARRAHAELAATHPVDSLDRGRHATAAEGFAREAARRRDHEDDVSHVAVA